MKQRTLKAEQSNPPAVPRLAYSMREAAEALGVSYISMHRLIKRGLIMSSSALRTKLIPAAELQRFLESSCAGHNGGSPTSPRAIHRVARD